MKHITTSLQHREKVAGQKKAGHASQMGNIKHYCSVSINVFVVIQLASLLLIFRKKIFHVKERVYQIRISLRGSLSDKPINN